MLTTTNNPSGLLNQIESGLSLTWTELRTGVAHYLGYGRTSGNWSTSQTSDVEAAVNGGYRDFCMAFDWSFLKPILTITTTTAVSNYDLPADFGGLEGTITFDVTRDYCSLPIIGEGQMREYQSQSDGSAIPRVAAFRPQRHNGTTGQRYELILWPAPDAAYVLSLRYYVLPAAMTTIRPYPLGGTGHAETILAACLAKAEQLFNDQVSEKREEYSRLLQFSKTRDGTAMKPQYYGMARDPLSDHAGRIYGGGRGYSRRHRGRVTMIVDTE